MSIFLTNKIVTATYNLSRKPENARKKLFRISISLIYKNTSPPTPSWSVSKRAKKWFYSCTRFEDNPTVCLTSPVPFLHPHVHAATVFVICDHLQHYCDSFATQVWNILLQTSQICFAKYFTSLLNNSQRIAGLQHCNISQDNLLCSFCNTFFAFENCLFCNISDHLLPADHNPDWAAKDCPSSPAC